MKKLKLFVEFCLICGISIVGSSAAGHQLIKTDGTFIGAIVGGLVGIIIASRIAVSFSLVNKSAFNFMISFSILGFLLAILISFYNFDNPVIVGMSTSLIGFGALLGDYLKRKSESRAARE